jgi:hypothetical protein
MCGFRRRAGPATPSGGTRWSSPRSSALPTRSSLPSVLVLVRRGSEVGVDEGGCSPTRARARCACRLSRIRPAASTPATPATAAKEGNRRGRSQRRTVEGVEMLTSGEERGSAYRRRGTCIDSARGIALASLASDRACSRVARRECGCASLRHRGRGSPGVSGPRLLVFGRPRASLALAAPRR